MSKLIGARQAAERLGIAPGTLSKMRIAGTSPPYRKIGAKVLYDQAELTAWIESRPRYRSTAESTTAAYTGRRRGRRPRAA